MIIKLNKKYTKKWLDIFDKQLIVVKGKVAFWKDDKFIYSTIVRNKQALKEYKQKYLKIIEVYNYSKEFEEKIKDYFKKNRVSLLKYNNIIFKIKNEE